MEYTIRDENGSFYSARFVQVDEIEYAFTSENKQEILNFAKEVKKQTYPSNRFWLFEFTEEEIKFED